MDEPRRHSRVRGRRRFDPSGSNRKNSYEDTQRRSYTPPHHNRDRSRRRWKRNSADRDNEYRGRSSLSIENRRRGYSPERDPSHRRERRRRERSRSNSYRRNEVNRSGGTSFDGSHHRSDSHRRKRRRHESFRQEEHRFNGDQEPFPGNDDRDHHDRRRGGAGDDPRLPGPPPDMAIPAAENANMRQVNRRKRRNRRRRKHRRHSRRSDTSSSTSSATNASPARAAGVVSDDEDTEVRKGQAASTTGRAGATATTRQTTRSSSSRDDTVGHFRGGSGAVVADRYRIIRDVGIGTFGRVVECLDLQRRSSRRNNRGRGGEAYVALKIVRNIKRYCDSAMIEASIIAELNRRGGRGLSHCVVMHDSFSFEGHYCMVFESLGPSLYDFLKRHNYQPFPMVCVQDFTVQLLEALEFLHSLRLIHTDLKIENILLMNDREVNCGNQRLPESTRIKIIDFGGACYDHDKKSSVINTRQYRAPEVILGVGWSMPSDMWSAGCILAELYQGELLFATHDNIEHLALIEQIIGYFPRRMVKAAKGGTQTKMADQAFDSNSRHRMGRALDYEKYSFVRRTRSLEQIVRNPQDSWFLGLLRQILVIDPTERATAHESLQFLSRIRKDVVLYT